MSVQLESESGA